MLAELFAVAFLMQNAPTTAPAIPSTPATPAATPPATLAAKWPQKVAEANEDIVGVVAKGTPIYLQVVGRSQLHRRPRLCNRRQRVVCRHSCE